MPEIGDVEGFRRTAESARGSLIRDVVIRDAGVVRNASAGALRAALRGRRIEHSDRAGKWLMLHTDGPTVLIHFGMTGTLRRAEDTTGRHPHDRVVLVLDEGELRYRDMRKLRGIFLAHDERDAARIIGPVGPDALGVDRSLLCERLASSRSSIKAALMDQTRIAGIGNILSDEILWRARIHPATPTRQLTEAQWRTLARALRSVVHAVARVGHTPRGPRWLAGTRDGAESACPACGAAVRRSTIAGRTAVWCPHCQRRGPA